MKDKRTRSLLRGDAEKRPDPPPPKQPGRLVDPDERTGKEWSVPNADPARTPDTTRPARPPQLDPERKIFGEPSLN